MKIKQILTILSCLAVLLCGAKSRAATLTKANTTTMNVAADWGGTAPAAGNVGQFTSTISAVNEAALTLGGNVALDGLTFLGTLNGPVIIGSGNTLTMGIGSGTTFGLSAANQDVTVNCAVTINNQNGQIFNVGSGRSLSFGGAVTCNQSSGNTLEIDGAGQVVITNTGAFNFPGANIGFYIGNGANSGTLVNYGVNSELNGSSGGNMHIGHGNSGTTGTFTMNAGVFSAHGNNSGPLPIADGASGCFGVLTINGGGFNTTAAGVANGVQLQVGALAGATGTLNLNGGLLQLNSMSTLAGTGNVFFNGGRLQAKVATTTFINAVTSCKISAGGLVLDDNNVNLTIPQALLNDTGSTGGGLTKWGTGTDIFTGANTYTGPTVINRGVLQLNDNAGTISSSSTLTLGGTGSFVADTTGAGAARNLNLSTLTFSGGDGEVRSTHTASFQSQITFSSLASRAAGAVGLFNYSGGTVGLATTAGTEINLAGQATGFINQGCFESTATGDRGDNYAYMNASGTYVRAPVYGTDSGFVTSAGGTTIGSASGSHVNLTANVTAQTTISYATLRVPAAITITLASAQTLTLASGGLLKQGGGTVTTITGGTAVDNNGVELVARTDQSTDLLTINTPLTGAGALTKSGQGTLTLGAADTYNGNTYVNAGTLTLGTGGSFNNSPSITVSAGATLTLPSGGYTFASSQDLAGSGTIGTGLATLGASGKIHPGGDGIFGTLTFGSGLTCASGSTLTFDLDDPNTVNDKIAVTGTLTCGGATIHVKPSASFKTGTYTLATATTVSGAFNSSVVFDTGTGTATISGSGVNPVTLTVTSYSPCVSPTAFTVGGGATICSGNTAQITLSGSQGGVNYQLYVGGSTPVGSAQAGTGSAMNNVSAWQVNSAGTYTIIGTRVTGGCTTTMTGSAVVTVNSALSSASISPSPASACLGNASALTVTTSGGTPSAYVWRKRGAGWGSGNAWTLNTTSGSGSFYIGSSTDNNNGDPASHSGNDINTGGNAWGIFNDSGVSDAVRNFSTPLALGQSISVDMDNGNINGTVGVGFRDSSGNARLEVYFVGGQSNYDFDDNAGQVASTVGFTRSGINIKMTLTGTNTYSCTITEYAGGTTSTRTGTLKGTAGNAISQIRLFNANGGGGNNNNLYFNSISLPGFDDNASNYTTTWNNGDNFGNGPLTNGGDYSGVNTATLTITASSTSDAGSYDVEAYNSCGSFVTASPVTLTVNSRPTSLASGSTTICPGNPTTISAALAGQGPWNVTWFDGTSVVATHNGVGGTGTSGTDTLSVSPASTKSYTVSALSDAKCTAQAGDRTGSAVVTVGTAPTATVTGTAAIRSGQSTTLHAALTGTGPWTVTWSDGHVDSNVGTGSSFTDNYLVSPSLNTTYTVTSVTDSSSPCSAGTSSGSAVMTVGTGYKITPATITAAAGASTTITVALVDSSGATVSGYNGAVNFTFSGLSPSPGGNNPTVNGTALGTPMSLTLASGQITTPVLIGYNAGTATLAVQDDSSPVISTSTTGGAGSSVTITKGLVTHVAWTTQPPASSVYGAAFSSQPVLQTLDQYNNPSTNGLPASYPVTVSGSVALISGATTSYDIGTGAVGPQAPGVLTGVGLGFQGGVNTSPTLTATVAQGYGTPPVASMSIWLDASDASTITGSSPVTQWNDKSGNGFNFVAFGTGTAPVVNNTPVQTGRKAITFGGQRFANSSYQNNVNVISVFIVYKGSGSRELATSNGSADDYNSTQSFEMDPKGGAFATQPHFFRANTGTGTLSYDSGSAYHAEEFISTGANDQLFVSTASALGTTAGSVGRNATYSIRKISIAGGITTSGNAGNGTLSGDICEVLVYNSDQSANRTAIETYLQNKWMVSTYPYQLAVTSTTSTSSGSLVNPATLTIASGVAVNSKTADSTTTATLSFGTIVFNGVVPADSANVSLDTSSYIANFSSASVGTWPVTVSGLALMGSASGNYTLTQPTGLSGTITAPYSGYTVQGGGSLQAGSPGETITITAVDSATNTVTTLNGPITLTFSGLSTAPDGSLSAVGGINLGSPTVLTFSGGQVTATLVAHKAESATLDVTDGTHTSGSSAGGSGLGLVVSAAADNAYRITTTNAAPVVGSSDTLTISIVDQYQNPSSFTGTKNITFGGLAAAPDGSLPTVNGTPFGTATAITFNSPASATLVAYKVESNKLLTAADDGTLTAAAAGGTAPTFSPTFAAATQLGIVTQPSTTAVAGVAFAQQPVIVVLDAYGNTVSNSTASVTATASAGNLQGTTSVNATSGTATFSGLSLTNVGSVALTFASTGVLSTNSTSITVSSGPAAALKWTSQPGSLVYGQTNFSSAPVVTVVDQFGNPTTNGLPASLLVNVAAKSGTGTGSLTGSTSYDVGTASGAPGVATFSGLGYASAVSGNSAVQLTATAGGYGAPPSGMAIWLDGSVASSVMTDGTGVVTNWLDLSGQGNNFSQTIGSGGNGIHYTNIVVNGRKAVTFGATGANAATELRNATYANSGNAISTFVVARMSAGGNSAGAFQRVLGTWAGNTANADWQSVGSFELDYNSNDNTPRIVRNSAAVDMDVSMTDSTAQWHAFEYVANGAVSPFNSFWLTLASTTTQATGPVQGSVNGNFSIVATSIGGGLSSSGSGLNNPYAGNLAEVLIYNSALSNADRQTVETYLRNKWMSAAYPNLTMDSTSFNVSPATVVPSVTVSSKTYDGTTNAPIATRSLSGIVGSDDVNLDTSGTAFFLDKLVAPGKPVTVTGLSLSGTTAGNYVLSNSSTNTTADITTRALAVSATGIDKFYDGNTNATVTLSDDRISGDSFTIGYTTAGFEDTAPGTNKPVHAFGIAITGGTDAGNYLANTTADTVASIISTIATVFLTSSSNPSAYAQSVSFTAAVSAQTGTPTGDVLFLANGIPFSTNPVVSGVAASAGLATLPRGTNGITAEFSGNGSFTGFAGTNSLPQIVTNTPPVAGTAHYSRPSGISLKIKIVDLLTNASDADLDTLSLAGVSATTTNGTALSTDSTYVFLNPNTVDDAFTYTVQDGFGGTNSGTVLISIVATNPGQSQIVFTGSTAILTFAGIPGRSYTAERATNVTFTGTLRTWTTNAPPAGVFQVIDDFSDLGAPPSSAFYWLRYNP